MLLALLRPTVQAEGPGAPPRGSLSLTLALSICTELPFRVWLRLVAVRADWVWL